MARIPGRSMKVDVMTGAEELMMLMTKERGRCARIRNCTNRAIGNALGG